MISNLSTRPYIIFQFISNPRYVSSTVKIHFRLSSRFRCATTNSSKIKGSGVVVLLPSPHEKSVETYQMELFQPDDNHLQVIFLDL